MIIIIEGQDNTGKSTLIDKLRKEYFNSSNTTVSHSSSPPKVVDPWSWEFNHYVHNTFVASKFPDAFFIFDRFHLGCIVYGKKYRNYTPTECDVMLKNIEMTLADDTVLITLVDEPESIVSRDDGLSLEKDLNDYKETKESFVEVFDKSTIRHKKLINITENGGVENTFKTVEEFLNSMRRHNVKSK